jgi:hypothetical protein
VVNHDFRRPLDGPEQDGGPGGRGGNYSHGQAQDDLLQFRHDSSNFGLRLVTPYCGKRERNASSPKKMFERGGARSIKR